MPPTATTAETAMHRSPAEPKPGVDRGVGGEVEVGVGQHDHVVLRAPERLDPLAGARAGLVDVPRDRRGADERDGLHVGVLEQPVDRDLVAVHDVEHPAGSPASAHSAASQFAADGSFSDGLSTTQFPHAIAIGKNQHGTIAGKLNGADHRDHAERLAERVRRRLSTRRSRRTRP